MSAPVDIFLSLVEHKRTGRDHGLFRVPTRDDKRMSGTWRELSDGRLLIHDFGGHSTIDILAAIGLDVTDLFPERTTHQPRPERRPFPASDVLRAVAFEAVVVKCAAARIRIGEPLIRQDHERLGLAVERLRNAVDAAGVSHG